MKCIRITSWNFDGIPAKLIGYYQIFTMTHAAISTRVWTIMRRCYQVVVSARVRDEGGRTVP